jgi:hypothetical protein
MKKNVLIVVLTVFAIGFAGFLFSRADNYFNQNRPADAEQSTQKEENKPAEESSELAKEEFDFNKIFGLVNMTEGYKLYFSERLGVGFTYDPTPVAGFEVTVTEKEDMIYIHGIKEDLKAGKTIEVFKKDSKMSLEEAIKIQFLAKYDPKDCFVKTYPIDPNFPGYVSAGISYPRPTEQETEEGLPWMKNAAKCPATYTETNGVQYFMMNKEVPTKYVFVRLGQDSITNDGSAKSADGSSKDWSSSIRILK